MFGFGLPEKELLEFLQTGELIDKITMPAISLQTRRDYGDYLNLSLLEEQVLNRVMHDLKQIDNLLNAVQGMPLAQCPGMDQQSPGHDGYTFIRFEFIGRHIIYIERNRDNFYWSIGVRINGADGVITGYHNNGTNGSLADVLEALENTKHLFPTPLRRSSRLERKRLRI